MSRRSVTSPEPKDTVIGTKVSGADGAAVAHAAQLRKTTVSAFIRDAVLPVARDTIVRHYTVKAPVQDGA